MTKKNPNLLLGRSCLRKRRAGAYCPRVTLLDAGNKGKECAVDLCVVIVPANIKCKVTSVQMPWRREGAIRGVRQQGPIPINARAQRLAVAPAIQVQVSLLFLLFWIRQDRQRVWRRSCLLPGLLVPPPFSFLSPSSFRKEQARGRASSRQRKAQHTSLRPLSSVHAGCIVVSVLPKPRQLFTCLIGHVRVRLRGSVAVSRKQSGCI
jgi:hypothetical protein